jgi:hypothetical protein
MLLILVNESVIYKCNYNKSFISMEDKSIELNNNIKIRYLESKGVYNFGRHILVFIHGLGSSDDKWLDPDALTILSYNSC